MGKKFSKTSHHGPKLCVLCRKPIKGRGVSNGGGGQYHAKCVEAAQKSVSEWASTLAKPQSGP